MRVIAGRLGGRNFDSPNTHRTHPMGDKIRGALFNALGDITGLRILDAFAGSGGLSFEAISRGAASAVALEIDKDAYLTIVKNAKLLDVTDSVMVLRKNASGWSRNNQHKHFDIVLADPPYNDIRPDVLQKLSHQVKQHGIFVLSWPGSEPVRDFEGLEQVSIKKYGDAQLVFYKKIG